MSIEYTIDIQLTELGFPDILPTSNIETVRCKPLNPAQSLQDEQDDKETAHVEPSEPSANDLTVGADTTDPPQLITGQVNKGKKHGDTAQEEEDDSDDSDVSEMYEEEEVDEDDEDEEGVNNESGDYRCSVCDLQLTSKFKLQDHMNLHTGARPYCCAECGKRFCQIYNYRVHLRTHAQIKQDRLRCRVCLKSFASQDDLNNHLSRTHLEDEFYECDLCKRVFTNLKECEYHVQLHKGLMYIACDKCGRNFSCQKSLIRHQKKTCFSSFKCTDCAKIFTKKNALLKHSFSHLGLLPYTCVRCNRHFRLAKLYRQHKCEPQRIHCVACLREFLSQEDFQQHKKDTGCWGNQEPKGDEIRCLECGQRFVTTEELKKHAGAHQRVLKCAECGKGFRSALLLMSHMGGHAGNAPCLCQSCGLGFPHQQSYDSHLKTCGQTPQPASAPKKRPAPKSSPPEAKRPKPDSSTPTNTVTKPAAPVNDSSSPGPVTEAESAGSSPADGLWKLTLDKQPPPGVNLVLFVPICPTQSNGLTLPSALSPTLPGSAVQFQPQHLGANAALGAPLDAPLDLVTGIKRDPEYDAPLDLSKKCNSSKSAVGDIPLLPVKSEPEDFEISGGTERQEMKSSDNNANVEPNPGETDACTEVKRFGMDPMDLSSKLIIDIKDEPQS
ncbi:uncharacterized protein [Pagrus major]|uniref:uncharacterized protein isoform X1 n=1 Tax=Pagrus major TaxID=143350 RepID=UPI003CC84365